MQSKIPIANSLLEILVRYAADVGNSKNRGFFNPLLNYFAILPYSKMARQAFSVGKRIQEHNHLKRKICLLIPTTPYSTVLGFYGAISAGNIPVIMPNAKALGNKEELNAKILNLKSNFGDDFVILLDSNFNFSLNNENLQRTLPFQLPVYPADDLPEIALPVTQIISKPDDTAFLQFTSASTGNSKAIAISNKNILSNIAAIKKAGRLTEDEIVVSWLPLYHDMGLVGGELFSLVNHYPIYLMSPFDFLKRPIRWMQAIDEYKVTIIGGPNFGFEYAVQQIDNEDLQELNLSSLKVACCGGEPIRINTISKFIKKFSSVGFSEKCFSPCYGLAETTLAATFDDITQPSRYLEIDPSSIGIGKRIKILNEDIIDFKTPLLYGGTHVISVGKPISDTTLWLANEDGLKINEELVSGEVYLKGPSIAQGYIKEVRKGITPFDDNLLKTGDIGFIYHDNLYVMERIKNILIQNGENYLATDLEIQISGVLNIPFDKIAVFETDIISKAEIVALIELPKNVQQGSIETLMGNFDLKIDLPVNRFIFTRDKAISRTTSGKKKHYMCRKYLKAKEFLIEFELSKDDLRKDQSITA